MVIKPEARLHAREIFEKWELDFAEIGRLTDTGHLVLRMYGRIAADLPVAPLVEQAPLYERPHVATLPAAAVPAASLPARDPLQALPAMLGSVAEFYEDDVATRTTAALSLIEPVIMIFMGIFVAFVLISLYLPIFSLADSIRP